VLLIIGYCLQSGRQVNRLGSLILVATILAAFLNWMWVRRRSSPEVSAP